MNAPSAIAGDVATLEQLAGQLSAVADDTGYAAARLDRLHGGTWLGAAATKFGDRAGELPPKLHTAADAFRSAEGAYRSYAADLSHAQSVALRAMSLWSTGVSATTTWRAQVDALPKGDPGKSAPDPGASLRGEASTVYRDAIDLVDGSARRAAAALHHAADLAPKKPGFWAKAWHAVTSFGDGMWDGTVGMVKMAWEFSPVRLLIDPKGWDHDVRAMGTAMYWGVTHPVEFAHAVGEDFMKDPAHALGELVPGLLVAAATGGAGLAATAVREGAERLATVGITTAEKIAAATRAGLEPRTVVHAMIEPDLPATAPLNVPLGATQAAIPPSVPRTRIPGPKGGTQAPDKRGRGGLPLSVGQRQGRHVLGDSTFKGPGYFATASDAQEVLSAFHDGRATVLGQRPNGNFLVRYDGVTAINHNPGAGFPHQPTHVFMLKGTTSVSVVPIEPGAKP